MELPCAFDFPLKASKDTITLHAPGPACTTDRKVYVRRRNCDVVGSLRSKNELCAAIQMIAPEWHPRATPIFAPDTVRESPLRPKGSEPVV